MWRARLRPRYERDVAMPAGEVATRLRQAVRDRGAPCGGLVLDRRFELVMRNRHLWSPELRVDALETGTGCALRGKYGPKPELWTLFVAMYGVLSFAAIAGAMWGVSQWLMGQTPWALTGVPLALVLALFVHVAANIGQRLGQSEMDRLAAFVDDALEAPTDRKPVLTRSV